MTTLAISGASVHFGGVKAVDEVSLSIERGERRGLLGPNGAGKTTLFNLVSGQVRASAGRIVMFGHEVTRLPPRERARLGLARTFQITKLFPNLTLRENVMLAVAATRPLRYAMHRTAASFGELQQRVDALLATWRLADKAPTLVRELSYGDQRQLEIVMALAGTPKLLLLDEPTAGLSIAETSLVIDLVARVPREVTVLFIEHDMDVAFGLADRITVMNQGRVIADGAPAAIRADPEIRRIYFGSLDTQK